MKSISKVNFMVQPSEKELGKGLSQGQGSFIHSFTFFSEVKFLDGFKSILFYLTFALCLCMKHCLGDPSPIHHDVVLH